MNKEKLPFGLVEDFHLAPSYIAQREDVEVELVMHPHWGEHKFKSYCLGRFYCKDTGSINLLGWVIREAIEKRQKEIGEDRLKIKYDFEIRKVESAEIYREENK